MAIYWTDGYYIWQWDGTAVTFTRPTVAANNYVSTLIYGPDALQVGFGPASSFTTNGLLGLDLQTYTTWPTLQIPNSFGGAPITVRRRTPYAIGTYDAVEDAYWLYIWNDADSDYRNNSSWQHWVKVSPSGALLSTHVAETWDYSMNPTDAYGTNAIKVDSFLYWSTEGHLWRYDTSTDTTTVLQFGSDTHRFWYRLVGALADGRLVFSTQGTASEPVSFDIVDVSAASWSSPFYPNTYNELPLAQAIYPAEEPDVIAMWNNEAGFAVVSGDICYYAVWDNTIGGQGALYAMNLADGSYERVAAHPSLVQIFGLAAPGAPPGPSGRPLDNRRRFT